MLVATLLAFALAAAPPDTMPPRSATAAPPVPAADSAPAIPRSVDAVADTGRVRPRPVAIDYDDDYYTRLTIHRDMSYAMYPIFAAQYVCGEKLWKLSRDAPTWAKTGHRVFATALVGVFGVNTVTGVWNLWDSRDDPNNRALRYTHAITMLLADGAFTYAGSTLATQAQNSLTKRQLHRTITLSAMGLTTASALVMTFFNR